MSEIKRQRFELLQTEELLKGFSSALRSRSLYPSGHPIVEISCRRLNDYFNKFFTKFDSWTIVLLGGEFVYEKVPLSKVSSLVRPFYRAMSSRNIESITIKKGTDAKELSEFIALLLLDDKIWNPGEDQIRHLASREINNITFQRLELPSEAPSVSIDTDEARDIYASLKHILTQLFLSMFDNRRTVSLDVINILKGRLIQTMEQDRFAIISRLHTRHHPEDLVAHSINTAIIAYTTAQSMGLPYSVLPDILIAGLLHDIGCIDIPPNYQNGIIHIAQEPLVYLEHPVRGLGILRAIPGVPTLAEVVAFEHHLQWDANGFPKLKVRRKMNIASLLVSLASQYDNMMHGDPPVPPSEIPQKLIRLAGKEFEPRLLAHFLRNFGVYPPGTYVRLTTDEVGLVVQSNKNDIYRPIVKMIVDKSGNEILDDLQMDLSERNKSTGSYLASIKNTVAPEALNL